ncbi:MAG: penicillin-binding protein 2, partial [Armatimonadetes bacterium]|nr:penicillin-binding protein 2 [Armatimonadota bacterium]
QWRLGSQFARVADGIQTRDQEIDADRGRIRDRRDGELAQDVAGRAIILNPRLVADPGATAARLAKVLRAEPEEAELIRSRLQRAWDRKSYYCRVRARVERKEAEAIRQLARSDPLLKGLFLERATVRVYPNAGEGIQVLGTVDLEGRGRGGVEGMYDEVLRGTPGRRRVRIDAAGDPIPETADAEMEPVDGGDVRLTLDRDIQHIVETELASVAKAESPDAATAIVMAVGADNPDSGHILAMANWPTYRPGDRRIKEEFRRNRTITDIYEPGSTFKVITAAAALHYGVDTTSYCSGSWTVGRYTMHCAHQKVHGPVPLRKMLSESCNLAAGTLAERLGERRFYDFIRRLGFGARTGVEFPLEAAGLLRKPSDWRRINTINIGFGQGISVSPLQLIAAYGAVANDGWYVPPRLVLHAAGKEAAARPPRRVMSAQTARAVRSYMQAVVSIGSGMRAQIPGYTVSGKTGTAQLVENGRYSDGYVASFAGMVPARKPQLAILVSVWRPRKRQYGGEVAAPAFRNIARKCILYLEIPEDSPLDRRDGAKEIYRSSVRD